jgi:hypothetical protein
MRTGEAAGYAAGIAVNGGIAVRDVNAKLVREMMKNNQA